MLRLMWCLYCLCWCYSPEELKLLLLLLLQREWELHRKGEVRGLERTGRG